MNREFQAAYVPIGVGTFHMPSAEAMFSESKTLLSELCPGIVVPEEMILNTDALSAYLDTLNPDLIILQNLTFANAAYTMEIMHRFRNVPLVLWTLREPVIDGGRLRLNALTGAFSAANTIRQFKKEPFEFVYGGPSEDQVKDTLKKMIEAARVRQEMQSLKVAAIGHTPQGFGFGRALDNDLLEVFGVRQEAIEARELIDLAKSFTDEECEVYLNDALSRTEGLDETPEKNRLDFARLYKAYDEYVKKNGIGAIASRCWPDFFTVFGTPVCMVLSILNDLGVAAACESDMYGALSMWIGMRLSGKSVFFGDPVSLDEKANTITFWHCGMAACSLAREALATRRPIRELVRSRGLLTEEELGALLDPAAIFWRKEDSEAMDWNEADALEFGERLSDLAKIRKVMYFLITFSEGLEPANLKASVVLNQLGWQLLVATPSPCPGGAEA